MIYIRNGKRFNIYASQTINEVTYPDFCSTGVQAALGITMVALPEPPADYSEETYYRTEQDDSPYVVFTKKSAEQLEELRKSKIPNALTMRQARLQMLSMGILTTVSSAIAAMTGDAGEAVKIAWEYSSMVERTNPVFASMQEMLGMTEEQADAFFTEGSKL